MDRHTRSPRALPRTGPTARKAPPALPPRRRPPSLRYRALRRSSVARRQYYHRLSFQYEISLLEHGPTARSPHRQRMQYAGGRHVCLGYDQWSHARQLWLDVGARLARHAPAAHARRQYPQLPPRRRYRYFAGLCRAQWDARGLRPRLWDHPPRNRNLTSPSKCWSFIVRTAPFRRILAGAPTECISYGFFSTRDQTTSLK